MFQRIMGFFIIALCAVSAAQAAAIGEEKSTAPAAVVARCTADLAGRLAVPETAITLVAQQPAAWPDAALGLPEPDKMYAQVFTPGWVITLQAQGHRYRYHASARASKYAGPQDLWNYSLLYQQPVADEPNLNGDLYQSSFFGTTTVRVARGVSEFYPQAGGTVLVTRRTSRSGFDLLLVRTDPGTEQWLSSAFAFGPAALNAVQDTWAAVVRPGLGTTWELHVAKCGAKKYQTLPLPADVQPDQLTWVDNTLTLRAQREAGPIYYVITPAADAPAWQASSPSMFPGLDLMLNKSESLEFTAINNNDTTDVVVASVWFTGDRTVLATIKDFALRGYLLDDGYAFLWGEHDGKQAIYAVAIATGEVISGPSVNARAIKPLLAPPAKLKVHPGPVLE